MPWDDAAYCTIEDVQQEAPSDFRLIVPDGQYEASGSGATIDAAGRWTLVAAEDLEALGVAAGDLVLLKGARNTPAGAYFGTSGEPAVVTNVAGPAATLRRPGKAASGLGRPYAPDTGLSGVDYDVPYLDRQIADARAWVLRELDYDDASDEVGDDDRRLLAVYHVLSRRYLDKARAPGSDKDHFYELHKRYAGDRDALRNRINARRRSLSRIDAVAVIPIDEDE